MSHLCHSTCEDQDGGVEEADTLFQTGAPEREREVTLWPRVAAMPQIREPALG